MEQRHNSQIAQKLKFLINIGSLLGRFLLQPWHFRVVEKRSLCPLETAF